MLQVYKGLQSEYLLYETVYNGEVKPASHASGICRLQTAPGRGGGHGHLGIPLQTRKTDFGLDSPVSEVSATTLSSNNQKYQNILKLSGMKKNFWMTMELSHQVVLLKQFCLGLFSKKQNVHVYSLCVLKQVYLWFRQFSVCCLFICSCQAHFVNKVVLVHRNIARHSRPPL